jgi:hypothetical protein
MLKIKFRNGLNGTLTDWTPFMVIQEIGIIKRGVESDNPGEAGLVVYDNVSLSFRYETGNPVYEAFNTSLSGAQFYIFEIFALKSSREEIKLFEGIADFTTLEWDLNERTVRFDVVDKIKALDLLTDNENQRGGLTDVVSRINCSDYLTDIIKRSITGSGVWLEIQTYNLINNNGTLERGEGIPHTQVILQKGEIFSHPGEGVGLCLVTDAELMTSMGGWVTTFVKVHPVKSCSLSLSLSSSDSSIVVSGNIFKENEVVYLENSSQIEFLKILNAGFGSEVSWIYNVERHYTGGNAYSWNIGEGVNYSDVNLTCITDLSNPPSSTHLFYYGNAYYNQSEINIFGFDSFGRNVLKAFDAMRIISGIVSRTLSPITIVNRTGAGSYPVSLNYYVKLCDASPFGRHSLDALKLIADSMRCYIFIDKQGRFIIERKNELGCLNSGTARTFDPVRLSAASVPRKYFWDKLIDGVETKITSDGNLSSTISKQIFANIKPRNELCKEIVALNSVEFTSKGLSGYASEVADDYLNFYGRRHDSYSVAISLYDDLLDWELLDYTSFNGKTCFFAGFEIDITGRDFRAELVTVEGEEYYIGQANIPLSPAKYNQASNSSAGSSSQSSAASGPGTVSGEYSANQPIVIESSVVKLNFEDNLVLSPGGKLDTAQSIKTTGTPQFAALAVGGIIDPSYKGKFYGDLKVTGKIEIDGDVNIGGVINEVNITELSVADKVIHLNSGGTDATAVDSGIKIAGSSGLTVASIIYDSNSNMTFNRSINLPQGNSLKINDSAALSEDTLGSGVLNSSLAKVGTITSGVWNGTPVNAPYINYNSINFQNTNSQLASRSITAGSNNGVTVNGTFNLGGTIVIDTPQDIRTTASPVFNNATLSSGALNSGSDLTITLAGNSILPNTGYAYNLGSISKKYLTLHAAELYVETLVSQNTKATIGGRVLIGESNELVYDLSSSTTHINVKYNNLAAGDIIYFEAGGKVEFMKVLYLVSYSQDNSEYQVQRNMDGSGANQWYAGDSLFNTGNGGDGFIDLYSSAGIKGAAQPGPTITGNVRNSQTYNDWCEHWAIGNLNGLYGYTSKVFGVGLGKYAVNSSYITIDASSGFAIKHKDNYGVETKMIELDSSGSGYFRGNINSTAVITGGVIQSAATGKRIIIDGSSNDIKFYNSSGEYIAIEGYLSAGNEKRLQIGGTILGVDDLIIGGTGQFSDTLITAKYLDAAEGIKIDEVEIIDKYYNASLHNVSANEYNGLKYKLFGNDLITARPAASKVLITSANQEITASSIASGELFTPAMCELLDETGNTTITCNGTNYVKWSNASVGLSKGIQGSTESDCIVISSGCAGKYEAHYSVTFKTNTAGDYYWSLKTGTNAINKSRSSTKAAGVDCLTNISGGCLAELSEGDQISIGCLGQNGAIVTVVYVNLRIVKCAN